MPCRAFGTELLSLKERISWGVNRMIMAWHRSDEDEQTTVPLHSLGFIQCLATALVPRRCRPQDLPIRSQFLGLDRARVDGAFEWGQGQARQYQQKGDRYLRGLFVAGALTVIRYAKIHGTKHQALAHGTAGSRSQPRFQAIATQPTSSAEDGLGHDGEGSALQEIPSALAA